MKKSVIRTQRYPLITPGKVKIPKQIEVPIFLIRHELKLRMVYQAIESIATVDCYFESHLDSLILASLKMWDAKDETYKVYFRLMDKWTKNINSDPDVITRRAITIYHALIKLRDRVKSR